MSLERADYNNVGVLYGEIVEFIETQGKYSIYEMDCNRLSGTVDSIVVSIRQIEDESLLGTIVEVFGMWTTKNVNDHLVSTFQVKELNEISNAKLITCAGDSHVVLRGTICKLADVRYTNLDPVLSKKILNMQIAVNTEKETSYIPCIAWNGIADRVANSMQVGTTVEIHGRIQSREYTKDNEVKTAYEVSIYKCDEI